MAGVPYVFASATTSIPLSQLDADFNTPVTIGNTSVGLGNTVTSFGNVTLVNPTLTSANVSISGGTANGVVYINSSNVAVGSPSVLSFTGTNLGIGTSSPTAPLVVGTATSQNSVFNTIIGSNSGSAGLVIVPGSTSTGYIGFNNANNSSIPGQFTYNFNTSTMNLFSSGSTTFTTNASGTAMTLDISGNLLVGQTSSTGGSRLNVTQLTQGTVMALTGGSTGALTQIYFVNPNGGVGSITTSGSATAYNTSSDRRLKTNIVDLTNSGTIIDSLKPRAFTWISDNSADAGFIADEIQTVLPKAVTGQPNAVDAEGKPVYQMIDASQPELIAYLVAEVQSLRARLKSANIA